MFAQIADLIELELAYQEENSFRLWSGKLPVTRLWTLHEVQKAEQWRKARTRQLLAAH